MSHPNQPPAGTAILPPELFQQTDSLTLLQRMVAGELPHPPIAATLNFRLTAVEKGRAVFSGTPGLEVYNPLGVVHGGYMATMLDSAMSCAVQSLLPAGQTYTTVEIKVNFVRPLTHQSGLIRAEGEVVHAGRRIATASGRLVDTNGKLYAHGTTTCYVFALDNG